MPDPIPFSPTQAVPYISPAGSEIDPWDAEEAFRAILPTFTDDRMTDFLLYRVYGFSVYEAADLAATSVPEVNHWRTQDLDFTTFERTQLRGLQTHLGPHLLYLQFARVMQLTVKADALIMAKVAFKGVDNLTKREYDWAKDAAKRYGPQELLAFTKAISPESNPGDKGDTNFIINVGDSAIDTTLQGHALANQVLDIFTVRNRIVEGEARLIDDDDSTS